MVLKDICRKGVKILYRILDLFFFMIILVIFLIILLPICSIIFIYSRLFQVKKKILRRWEKNNLKFLHIATCDVDKFVVQNKKLWLLDVVSIDNYFKKIYWVSFPAYSNGTKFFLKYNAKFILIKPILKNKKEKFAFIYYLINTIRFFCKIIYILLKDDIEIFHTSDIIYTGFICSLIKIITNRVLIVRDVIMRTFVYREQLLFNNKFITDIFEKITYKSADFVFAIQKSQIEYYLSRGVKSFDKIGITYYHPVFKRSKSGFINFKFNSNCPIILYFGRFHKEKLVIDILKACKMLHNDNINFKFSLIGEGPEKERLIKFLYENLPSEKFEVLPYLSEIELFKKIKESDINIHPTGGAALTESLSSGKVCITYDNNTWDYELIENKKTGMKAKFREPESIYKCIKYLIEHPDETIKIAKNGYNKVYEVLGWEKFIERRKAAFDKCFKYIKEELK